MDAMKQYYRIADMPLAMQVWLYECCSSVDSKIAINESSRIPRLLNWRTIDKRPHYEYLMEGMFRDNENPITYQNISPTLKEIAFLQIPSEKGAGDITFSEIAVDEDEDDIFTSIPPIQMLKKKGEEKKQVDVSSLPPKKKRRQHVGESIGEKISLNSPVVPTKVNTNVSTENFQKQPKESIDNDAADEIPSVGLTEKQSSSNADEIGKLREDLAKLKDSVFAELKELRLLILENFKNLMDAINVNRTTEEAFQATHSKPPSQHPKVQDHYITTHADRFEALEDHSNGHPVETFISAPNEKHTAKEHNGRSTATEILQSNSLASNKAEIKQSDQHEQRDFNEGLHNANNPKVSAQMDDEQQVFGSPIQMVDPYLQATSIKQPESQFELLDELLPSLNPERTSVAQSEDVVYDVTPLPIQRIRQSGWWNCSSYSTNYGSSAGSSSNVIRIYEKKYPFVCDFIQGPYNYDLFEATQIGSVKDSLSGMNINHYKKNKATLLIPMDLGINLITNKNWFYTLSFDGQLLNDGHIDVILYYLRKKNKYNINIRYKYTTIDCLFYTKIAKIYAEYTDLESETCVTIEENVIREYINGYRLMAAISWNTVNHVFIPINVKEKSHWVLVVLTFAERRINVYDSYRSAGHDAFVRGEIHKLAELMPMYLSMYSGNNIDDSQDQNIPFDVIYVDDIPQQRYGGMDCGLYLLAYVEYLSAGDGISVEYFDAELLRIRYGALLWDYASKKAEDRAISDNEAHAKIIRPHVEIDSCERILIT